jgi:TolB-like protein
VSAFFSGFRFLIFLLLLFTPSALHAAKGLKVVILPFENLTGSDALEWMGRSLQRSVGLELKRMKGIGIVNIDIFRVPKYERLFSEYTKAIKKTGADILISGSFQTEGARLIVSTIMVGGKELSGEYSIWSFGDYGILDLLRVAGRTDMVYELKLHISRLVKLELIGMLSEKDSTSFPFLIIGGEVAQRDSESVDISYAKEALEHLGKIDISMLEGGVRHRRRAFAAKLYNKGVELSDRSDEEIMYYIKALLIDPDLVQAWYNLGVIYVQKGDIPRAIYYLVGFLERAFDKRFEKLRDRVKTVIFRIIPKPEELVFDRELALKFFERALELADFSNDEVKNLESSVRSDPTLWPVRRRLAEAYFVRGLY